MITIVYIGATWCGVCRTVKPALVELCKKYSVELQLLDYDIDLEEEAQEEIKKVPTVRIFKDGRKLHEFNIAQVQSTEDWLSENIKLATTDDF